MLHCSKGCSRRVARYTNGTLAFQAHDVWGFPQTKQANLVPPPSGMQKAFSDMIACTTLRSHPPALEFYDNLHGAGGMFVPDQWVIMVGLRDMREIAADVAQRWPDELINLYAGGYGGRRASTPQLVEYSITAATGRCIAHEIGHAMIYKGYWNPYDPDQEAGADYYAGKLDAARGRSRALGKMFFFSIGCVGPSCDHPSPSVRAAAYDAGYDEQRRAA